MLAIVSANDFGYITIDDLVGATSARLKPLVGSMFLNAIFLIGMTSALSALHPRYVSAVDSNLLASLWTFETVVRIGHAFPSGWSALCGIADTLSVLRQIAPA